jgi:glycosyltransferase involved in cell wall biosynthesis
MSLISICIPVYNFPIEPLIKNLSQEISTRSIDAQIVVIDDASDVFFQTANHATCEKYRVSYMQLDKNVGRSAIRNRFVQYTKSPLLLFLDCDVMPVNNLFISAYLSEFRNETVICGGLRYAETAPAAAYKLHWKYGRTREALTAKIRNKKPYHHFLTSNFLIHKKILEKIPFNEKLEGYGYEDTLYGIEMKRNNVDLRHIDLPVEHLKIDTAEEFVVKTENALENLYRIYETEVYKSILKHHIRLIRANNTLTSFRLAPIGLFMYNRLGNFFRRKLINGNINLTLLDVYKLLFFISLRKK